MSGSLRHTSHSSWSASTSTPSCTSPNTDFCSSALTTNSARSAAETVANAPKSVSISRRRSGSATFASSTSAMLGYDSFRTSSV